MSTPKLLKYKNVKPKGFASEVKQWSVYPVSQFNSFNKGELMRFNFQTDQFIEPQHSYLEIEIEMPIEDYKFTEIRHAPGLLLDQSSTSLISEMILYSNGNEVERIQEYDQIGVLLNDFSAIPENKSYKSYQGMRMGKMYNNDSRLLGEKESKVDLQIFNMGAEQQPLDFSRWKKEFQIYDNPFSGYDFGHIEGGNITNASNDIYQTLKQAWKVHPANLQRFLKNEKSLVNSFERISTLLNESYFQQNAMENLIMHDSTYGVNHAEQFTMPPQFLSKKKVGETLAMGDVRAIGISKAFNYTSSNCQDDYIFPWMQRASVRDGLFLNKVGLENHSIAVTQELISQRCQPYDNYSNQTQDQSKYLVNRKKFKIPILSGVLGTLIPKSEKVLIPGAGCGQLMFEFRINPHAFYLSGTKQGDGFDTTPLAQWQTSWKVVNVRLNFELWKFDDSVMNQVRSQLNSGILLSSVSFSQGPIYNVPKNGNVSNNWHVLNGIPSVKNLFVWFLNNDYQKYNYLRKNYRISMNVTSMQLKLGDQLVPQQPIEGVAGNPIAFLDKDKDCFPFLEQIHKTIGCFFEPSVHININESNFCVTERPYNYLDPIQVSGQQSQWHEQRLIGKALYTIDCETDPHDQTVLTGMNIANKRPIELILKNDWKGGDINATMYIMLYHDFLVQFTSDGIQTSGRG